MGTAHSTPPAVAPVTVEFLPTRRELFDANLYIGLCRFKVVLYVLFGFSLFAAAVTFSAKLIVPGATSGFTPEILFVIFGSPLLFLGSIVATSYFEARSFTAGTAPAASPARWQFAESGIFFEHPSGTSHLNWSAYLQARETKTLFLLFPHKNTAHLIPKRAFASADDLARFRELLARRYPTIRQPPPGPLL